MVPMLASAWLPRLFLVVVLAAAAAATTSSGGTIWHPCVVGGDVDAAASCLQRLKTDDGGGSTSDGRGTQLPTCTLPHGSCCRSTIWSTFKWRAKASANIPFSLGSGFGGASAAEPPWSAAPPSSVAPGPVHGDLFTLCLADKRIDGCTNATAAGTWSGWHDFTAKASAALCETYPNAAMDPSWSMVLSASVQGIQPGNMSTITLDIQPGGPRAHESTYMINVTVTPLRQMEDGGSNFAPAVRLLTPNFYLVIAAENNTMQPPVITGRAYNQKYYAAMPQSLAMKTPHRIRILQEYDSRDNDVGAHLDAFKALVNQLGASALKVAGSSAAEQQLAAAAGATYAGGRLTAPCNHTRCKTDHSFPNVTTDQDVDAMVNNWAIAWVEMMKGTGANMSALTQMEMYDEIGWSFPSVLAGSECYYANIDCFNVSLNDRVLTRFHNYIRTKSGLHSPTDFGAETWSDVLPLTNLSVIELGTNPKQVQAQRILFYWSIRYTAHDIETYFARVVAAVARANGNEPVGAFLNCNNFHGRLYEPLGPRITFRDGLRRTPTTTTHDGNMHKVQGSTVGENAKGGIDWFEAGRLRSGDILWTEDVSHVQPTSVAWLAAKNPATASLRLRHTPDVAGCLQTTVVWR